MASLAGREKDDRQARSIEAPRKRDAGTIHLPGHLRELTPDGWRADVGGQALQGDRVLFGDDASVVEDEPHHVRLTRDHRGFEWRQRHVLAGTQRAACGVAPVGIGADHDLPDDLSSIAKRDRP